MCINSFLTLTNSLSCQILKIDLTDRNFQSQQKSQEQCVKFKRAKKNQRFGGVFQYVLTKQIYHVKPHPCVRMHCVIEFGKRILLTNFTHNCWISLLQSSQSDTWFLKNRFLKGRPFKKKIADFLRHIDIAHLGSVNEIKFVFLIMNIVTNQNYCLSLKYKA